MSIKKKELDDYDKFSDNNLHHWYGNPKTNMSMGSILIAGLVVSGAIFTIAYIVASWK